MRRYDDPVEVRRGQVKDLVGGAQDEGPEQFLWRGKLWKVRAVLAHWVETGPWWQSAGVRAVVGSDEVGEAVLGHTPGPGPGGTDLLAERELWRVEAGRTPGTTGVFDLSFDWSDGRWQLVGCVD